MKRGKPLKRTELKRKTPLRSGPVKPRRANTEAGLVAAVPRRAKSSGPVKPKRPTGDARRAEESARLKVWARASQPHGVALCEVCGERTPTNYQHRKARAHCSKDELWAASNGLAVCGDGNLPTGCHGKRIHLEPLAAKAAGWICESWLDPRDKPVLRFGEWVLLNDDGGFEPVEKGTAA